MPEDPVQRLGELLAQPHMHADLVRDPAATLKAAGVDPKALSPGVVNTLKTLTPEELGVLVKVKADLKRKGVPFKEIIEIF